VVVAGQIVQFVGDSNLHLLGSTGCASHDEDWNTCWLDTGFTFRRVTGFQEEGCSYTEEQTCYVCKVRCCFWWNYQLICGSCSCSSDPWDLCKTLWEVVTFHEDGETGCGCYELEFVSDCPNEDCDGGLDMCTTKLKWNEE